MKYMKKGTLMVVAIDSNGVVDFKHDNRCACFVCALKYIEANAYRCRWRPAGTIPNIRGESKPVPAPETVRGKRHFFEPNSINRSDQDWEMYK